LIRSIAFFEIAMIFLFLILPTLLLSAFRLPRVYIV
jgi:hypothetical protein